MFAGVLGKAKVNIVANLKPLREGLKKAFTMVKSSITSITRNIIRYGKWAALGLFAVGAAAVKMAADAQESENLFEVSMGNMADATRKWSNELSKALGLNQYNVRRMVSTFNVMLGSMGLGEKEAANMSKSLTQLAYDMASFYNLKVDDAFLKLQAGISGEIEPLKRLGIILKETQISERALTEGIIKRGQQLTEIQKIQLRYKMIVEQTTKAQGDLARTKWSLTNVGRRLAERIKEIAVSFGSKLIPQVTKAAIKLDQFLTDNASTFEEWGKKVGEWLADVIAYFEDLKSIADSEGLKSAFEKLFKDLQDIIVKTVKFLKETILPVVIQLGKIMADAFWEAFGGRIKQMITNFGRNIYRITPRGLAQTADDLEFLRNQNKDIERNARHLNKLRQQRGRMGDML